MRPRSWGKKEDMQTITLDDLASGARLDQAIASRLPEFSRSRIQALIKEGRLQANGKPISDPAGKTKAGMVYTLTIPDMKALTLTPENIALDIVFEDEHLLVVNKQAGMTVHPSTGHAEGTLVHALLYHCGDSLSGIGGVGRPGIVHRLDKDTSGLMVVAKHDAAHQHLSNQLSKRTLKRAYNAVIWGRMQMPDGMLEGAIGRSSANRKKMAVTKTGKEARTHYQELEVYWTEKSGKRPALPLASLIECHLDTGRTHQIRVHFSAAGRGLVGDPLYGSMAAHRLKQHSEKSVYPSVFKALSEFSRQALHALEIGFIHPTLHTPMYFTSDLPDDLKNLISILKTDARFNT